MHWETNGHLGGMPLQLYHLVTPGGHKCGMAACDSPGENVDERFGVGDNYTVEKSHILNVITVVL